MDVLRCFSPEAIPEALGLTQQENLVLWESPPEKKRCCKGETCIFTSPALLEAICVFVY